jgi:hypothetical protein
MEITSLSPQNQVTFNKYSPNEIVAVVHVPELAKSSSSSIRHSASQSEFYERPPLNYQRTHASSYRPPMITERQSRLRIGKFNKKYSNFF